MSFVSQLRFLTAHYIRNELANREKIISPILFATTTLLLCFFAFGELDQRVRLQVFVAETYLALFLAMQIAFLRVFEDDTADGAFDFIRIHPIRPEAWFISKFAVVFCFSAIILTVVFLMAAFFHQQRGQDMLPWSLFLIGLLALLGMTGLGILLSAMTLRADARQVLYPILYFPLTTPVLLAAVQSSVEILQKNTPLADLWGSWLGILVIFDVIYLTLSMLLYGELLKPE